MADSDTKYAAKKHTLTHVFDDIQSNISWDRNRIPDVNELISFGSAVHSGLMSSADKSKLDTLSTGGSLSSAGSIVVGSFTVIGNQETMTAGITCTRTGNNTVTSSSAAFVAGDVGFSFLNLL